MSNLIKIIESRRYAIARPEIRNGELKQLLSLGLLKVAACDYGSKRSFEGARIATSKNVPTVYLIGGLSGILDNLGHPGYEHLIGELNRVPELAVIVWKHELDRYQPILKNLNYSYYQTIDHFSDALPPHYH